MTASTRPLHCDAPVLSAFWLGDYIASTTRIWRPRTGPALDHAIGLFQRLELGPAGLAPGVGVQCAHEHARAAGVEEARHAFHEDARWRSGPVYVFVNELAPVTGAAHSLVFPPDPSREGTPWG